MYGNRRLRRSDTERVREVTKASAPGAHWLSVCGQKKKPHRSPQQRRYRAGPGSNESISTGCALAVRLRAKKKPHRSPQQRRYRAGPGSNEKIGTQHALAVRLRAKKKPRRRSPQRRYRAGPGSNEKISTKHALAVRPYGHEMTLDYSLLSDSRNFFCSQGSFLFSLVI